jgi:hypothetical protein
MSLTIDEIKTKSLSERIGALDNYQIQSLLDITESLLIGVGLDATATGYTVTFNRAQTMAFDWIVNNPNFLRSLQQGRFVELYQVELPSPILFVLCSIRGGIGELTREGGH